ncbi:MAG TPA: DUF2255 family protein [Candidatus Limnocylindria bacterium]|nr:DUF2255 family protein [Candidatus Limnocylindria bacterium]
MTGAFPELLLQLFDVTKEIDVETRSEDGAVHRVPIWVVVVDGEVYVRSVRGPRGRWYRELLARRSAVLHVGSRGVEVRPVKVTATETIDEVSAGFWRKYERSASLFSMLRLSTLHTTLRLEPA